MNTDINTKRLRSRTVNLNMTDQENATPLADSGPDMSLPPPLTTRNDTNTTPDASIDKLCRALNTLIDNHEKTHQTLMTHIVKPQNNAQEATINSDTRNDRRSTDSIKTGRSHSNRQISKDIKFGGASQEDVMVFINNLHRYATFVQLSDQDLCDLFPLTLTNRAEFLYQSLPSSVTQTGPVYPMRTSTNMGRRPEDLCMRPLSWRECRTQREMSIRMRVR